MFKEKLKREWQIFRQVWKEIFVNAFVMYYIAKIVTRKLALYVYDASQPVLYDVGFEIVPELKDARLISEMFVLIIHLLILYICILAFMSKDVYVVNILRRYLLVISIGQMIRATTFLPTSLPGPAEHCREGSPNLRSIENFSDIFWDTDSIDSIFYNCGDLIFSGHMLHMTVGVHLVMYYYMLLKNRVWINFIFCLIPLQAFVILASRQHYTVDLVVGFYVGTFLWLTTIERIKDKTIVEPVQIELYEFRA